MEKYKEKLLKQLEKHIDFVRLEIQKKLENAKVLASQSLKGFGRLLAEDQAVFMSLRGHAHKRVRELTVLEGSPYFMKIEILDEKGVNKNYFFAKHEFSEEKIYSWVAPVSAIRFENPGKASYKLPNGEVITVTIKQKEQYMIVNGKVMFFSLETKDKARELIFQEHFTKQKSGFILPEIVAQMEKAQDQVIRAEARGPLVISGPAGSGKTTLALHRVAYMTQVPDIAKLYPAYSIMVLVQDNGTKDYFSTLLPSLGINDVKIITFSEWAFKVLGLVDYIYGDRYGETEDKKDAYEYSKLRAIRLGSIPAWNKSIFKTLEGFYAPAFKLGDAKIFATQKQEKKLDRFDLVVLLQSYFAKYKKFEIKREYNTSINEKIVRKTEKTLVNYSLMIIDEFQNYLPEQIRILKNCVDSTTESIVYVGDMAQQVKLGTIKNMEDAGEVVSKDRNITLHKVYRNTKNILSFVKNLGYQVELPDGLKEGPIVLEKTADTIDEEIEHIKDHISRYAEGSIGILSKREEHLVKFKKEFADFKNVHVLTMLEAQGVEFDWVCIVGVKKGAFSVVTGEDMDQAHILERKKMQKDLLYVALTRAITELHILGTDKLDSVL
ncbi:MAG: AAA family ATPase [Candidatus Pacebacteria bacterium]|nr:AAA family ATPase [Candidatus Paceibacterota bacterium]